MVDAFKEWREYTTQFKMGSRPTILIREGLQLPPPCLIPPDAKLKQVPTIQPRDLRGCLYERTLAEAAEMGLAAPPLWPGLGEIPPGLKEGFHSLLILGPSGSGKTSLLKAMMSELFPDFEGPLYPSSEWPFGRALIEAFGTADEGRDLLGGVGLGTVPSWLKPYEVLSPGEKYRANVARAVGKRRRNPKMPLILDEWTSELDRNLARVVSLAFGKRMSRENQGLLAPGDPNAPGQSGPAPSAKRPMREEETNGMKGEQSAQAVHEKESEAVVQIQSTTAVVAPVEASGAVAAGQQPQPSRPGADRQGSDDAAVLVDGAAEIDGECSAEATAIVSDVAAAPVEAAHEVDDTDEDDAAVIVAGKADTKIDGEDEEFPRLAGFPENLEGNVDSAFDACPSTSTAAQAAAPSPVEDVVMAPASSSTDEGREGDEAIGKIGADGGEGDVESGKAGKIGAPVEVLEEVDENSKEEKETKAPAEKVGPFIFASCHDDVAAYLQPECICLCSAGEAPRLVQNSAPGATPQVHAMLLGNLEPPSVLGGDHRLVGPWQSREKGLPSFMICYRSVKERGTFKLNFEGGERVEPLRRTQFEEDEKEDPSLPGAESDWYSGLSTGGEEVRLRLVDSESLVVQVRTSRSVPWEKAVGATRRSLPSPMQTLMMAKDPEAFMRTSGVVFDYVDVDQEALKECGWYVPPELMHDTLYKGLERQGSAIKCGLADFRFDPRQEEVGDGQVYVATYVGEPDGSLEPKLANVSRLLDCPFNGLCLHRLPRLPDLGEFHVGMITGPSGSGKSTLTRETFGPSPAVGWVENVPVIGHFSSLARAREFLEASHLDLNLAMRPFAQLSGGEQARALLARLLDAAASDAEAFEEGILDSLNFLVIDEFTALVDRETAKQMARGLRRLATTRGLRNIVVVSCHCDFVAEGLLEPDWLFECHTGRFLRFNTRAGEKLRSNETALSAQVVKARRSAHQAAQELQSLRERLDFHAACPFWSENYRAAVVALGGALETLGQRELRIQQDDVAAKVAELEDRKLEAGSDAYREESPSYESKPEPVANDSASGGESEALWGSEAWLAQALAPPVVHLEVRRALPREWAHFREHHYKDHALNAAAVTFVGLVGGTAVAFLAIICQATNFVYRSAKCAELEGRCSDWYDIGYPWKSDPEPRRLFREHRTVVRPDFQGMGIAPLLCDTVARLFHECGHDFTSQTVHPFYGSYRDRSLFWCQLPTNRKERSEINGNKKYSHFFSGAVLPDGTKDAARELELRRRCGLEREPTLVPSEPSQVTLPPPCAGRPQKRKRKAPVVVPERPGASNGSGKGRSRK
eukprot:TRINITY_DN20442_c0_g1_i1.p1 TRINITY_DN20442_c0_g1~~TRINITY_DN20442_c0_g1_i1.p1  ORF type:complete len:1473 (+),score=279.80 TRINITY_DN20442_c0_g1_i1:452-4420(+)